MNQSGTRELLKYVFGDDCIGCHMPSVAPQAHLAFTNHWIGIYRARIGLAPCAVENLYRPSIAAKLFRMAFDQGMIRSEILLGNRQCPPIKRLRAFGGLPWR